jgi:magnesium-dependent phosphatase 1
MKSSIHREAEASIFKSELLVLVILTTLLRKCTMLFIFLSLSLYVVGSENLLTVGAFNPVKPICSRMARHIDGSRRWGSPNPSEVIEPNNTPKLIVFDLDGCLWRPEMYELIHFMGNKGAPFRPSEHDMNVLLTVGDEPVQLLKDVREVMRELYLEPQWKNVPVGISSRTDAPHWARELLGKFSVQHEKGEFVLDEVFRNGPIEMQFDSKIEHFHRIAQETNIAMEDMVFFDNEYGNCESVAGLGVTVGYCPGGVSKDIWQAALEAFPAKRGVVVEL